MAIPPTTTQLYDFADYPDEDPLSIGGAFSEYDYGASGPLRLSGGCVTDEAHVTVIAGPIYYSFLTTQQWSDDVEVWACTSGGQLGAAVESWRVGLAQGAPVNSGRKVGYLALFGGGIGKAYQLRRYDGDPVWATLAEVGDGYPDKILLRTNGPDVEVWGEDAGVWSLKISEPDNTYRGPFNLFLGIEDPTSGGLCISCMGGGVKNRTQIYRVLRGLAVT